MKCFEWFVFRRFCVKSLIIIIVIKFTIAIVVLIKRRMSSNSLSDNMYLTGIARGKLVLMNGFAGNNKKQP